MGFNQAIQHLTEKVAELSTEGRILFALTIQLPVLFKLFVGIRKYKIFEEMVEDRLFWGIVLALWSLSFLVIEGIIIGALELGLWLTLTALVISAIFYFASPKILKRGISFKSIEKDISTSTKDTGIDFCRTGIQWKFDSILGGGIPRGQVVLVTGDYGTGKTILGLEFLYNGAKFYKEKGAFLSLNETLDDLDENTRDIGWILKDFMDSIHIERMLPANFGFFPNIFTAEIKPKNLEISPEKILCKVQSLARNKKDELKRIVIDPFPCIGISKEKNDEILRFYQMLNLIAKKYKLVCMVISHSQKETTYWDIEPFLTDTVYVLSKKNLTDGRVIRTIQIEKNRGTHAFPNEYVFEIRGKKDKPYKLKGVILRNKDKEDFEEVPGIWVSSTSFGTFGAAEGNNIETQ